MASNMRGVVFRPGRLGSTSKIPKQFAASTRHVAPAGALLCLMLALLTAPPTAAAFPDVPSKAPLSVTLDAVSLQLAGSFLPDAEIFAATPGDRSQVASVDTWAPFKEVSITAVAYGTKPGTEALPVAEAGGAEAYRLALENYRHSQGAASVASGTPIVRLFGQDVPGRSYILSLHIDGETLKPALLAEWVVEAGQRIWIVRAGQELPTPAALSEEAVADSSEAMSDLTVSSSIGSLAQPSTLTARIPARPNSSTVTDRSLAAAAASTLPSPYWWNGDCDYYHYVAGSGQASFRLGNVYRGMPACGPRPLAGGVDVVTTFPGGWGEYEWECSELAMRYLYLAYGIPAYHGNGSGVVWNYSGATLQRIGNGSVGAAPQPGDVLSYGPLTTAGHSSIVTASSVPNSGTCSYCISVIEQNNSASGSPTALSISNWTVTGGPYAVTGWLHFPTAPTAVAGQITSPANGTTLTGAQVTFHWNGTGVAQYYLAVGNGVGAADVYGAYQGTNQSAQVGVPTDGRRLYVRLYSLLGNTWSSNDYQYTAYKVASPGNGSPQLTSPPPGSTLPGRTVTFQWAAGTGVSQYFLYVGDSVGSNDLYGASEGTNRSASVYNLPADGRKIWVRLWWLLASGWYAQDYTYYAYP